MRFVAALERTTADDLRALAERYVDPDAACIVIVGDRAAIEPGLRELGLPRAGPLRRRRRPAVAVASDRLRTRQAAARSSRRFFSFWRARSRRVPTVERGIVSLSAISS